jgi:AraC-like DNA-binding protein
MDMKTDSLFASVDTPSVSIDLIRAHLAALRQYLDQRGDGAAFDSVYRTLETGLKAYPSGSRIPAHLVGQNLDIVAEWLNEPCIGLKLAPYSTRLPPAMTFFFDPQQFGLRDYLVILRRYLSVTTQVLTPEISVSSYDVTVTCRAPEGLSVSRHQYEGFAAALCSAVSAHYDLSPIQVSFAHEPVGEQLALYREALGVMPEFSAREVRVRFPLAPSLSRDNRQAPFSDSFTQIQRLEMRHRQQAQSEHWRDRCYFLLDILMCYGEPNKTAIADLLAVTPRTLQRRLADEGTSFRTLLNELRYERATDYLKRPDLSLDDITFLLGFRDSTVFYRAFKQWSGKTPGEYREQSLAEVTEA